MVVVLLVGNLFVWGVVWQSQPTDFLQVAFLDVGQGDAILITAPNKNQILIDGGPDKKVIRALGRAVPFFDRSIDLVVATHPDLDHIGGLPDVFDRFAVLAYLAPETASESAAYQALQTKIEAERAQKLLAQEGMKVILDQNTWLEIFNAGTKTAKVTRLRLWLSLPMGKLIFY